MHSFKSSKHFPSKTEKTQICKIQIEVLCQYLLSLNIVARWVVNTAAWLVQCQSTGCQSDKDVRVRVCVQ